METITLTRERIASLCKRANRSVADWRLLLEIADRVCGGPFAFDLPTSYVREALLQHVGESVTLESTEEGPNSDRASESPNPSPRRKVEPMTTKKTAAKKTSTKPAKKAASKKAAPAKPAKKTTGGKLSALDAAARVLAESKEPMSTKQLIETMAAKRLWTSPGGKTPAATLYSAILREIGAKGSEARFQKVDRGRFAAKA